MGLLEAHAGLAGKVAVLVGGSGGVGRAVTLALAKAGIGIATCDRDAEATRNIVTEVEALGQKVLSMHADVCDADALDRFYDRVEREFDRLDIVVNVAGGVKRAPFLETTREQNAKEIRRNYGYVIDSFRRAIPLIRKGGRGGSIVNFTTIEAHRGAATFSVYAGAKAATTNFTRAMAVELGAEHIRVNTIAPDTTPSRAAYEVMEPQIMANLGKLSQYTLAQAYNMYIPQKQPPAEEDLANAVLFLVSDLSSTITGTILHVDGGTMAASGFIDWPFGDGHLPGPLAGTLSRLFEGDEQAAPTSRG
jgi:NAD(P)-dependent dehydrogenase (short-subunit alcohol dehydrogenase family)